MNIATIPALVDDLISQAEERPKGSHSASCLRDAAASLLDAARSIEIEDNHTNRRTER